MIKIHINIKFWNTLYIKNIFILNGSNFKCGAPIWSLNWGFLALEENPLLLTQFQLLVYHYSTKIFEWSQGVWYPPLLFQIQRSRSTSFDYGSSVGATTGQACNNFSETPWWGSFKDNPDRWKDEFHPLLLMLFSKFSSKGVGPTIWLKIMETYLSHHRQQFSGTPSWSPYKNNPDL